MAKNDEEVRTYLTTFEKGADGVAVFGDRETLRYYYSIVKSVNEKIELKEASITDIKVLGIGERVCLDTVTIMNRGEGVLVGNQSNFMFLVASETEGSEYSPPRPFRVNAGSVNAYVKVGNKTAYLSEMEAGCEIEIVKHDGSSRMSYVGRAKIERRPLILVKAKFEDFSGTVIVQNAETIKFVKPNGDHISVTDLVENEKVCVWINSKPRHLGVSVNEFIIEK